MKYIDHAIKLEREHYLDDYPDYWSYKMGWLPDEEAIKFLDEEIKATSSSSMDEEDKKGLIQRSICYKTNTIVFNERIYLHE